MAEGKTDNSTEKLTDQVKIGSTADKDIHESSAGVFQQPDTERVSATIDTSFSQDKQDAALVSTQSSIEEDFSLRVHSSDDEDDEKLADKPKDTINKSETLFSDIESSDDSIAYAPAKITERKESEGKTSNSAVLDSDESKGQKKQEFDLVDSDEEFFEESPLSKKTDEVKKDILLAESVNEEKGESDCLTNDEANKPSEPNLDENVESPQPKETCEATQKTSSNLEDSLNSDSEDINPEIEASHISIKDDSTEVDEELTLGSQKPNDTSSSIVLKDSSENLSDISEAEMMEVEKVNDKMTTNSPKPSGNSETTPINSALNPIEENASTEEPETTKTDVEMRELNEDENLENNNQSQGKDKMEIDDLSLDETELSTNKDKDETNDEQEEQETINETTEEAPKSPESDPAESINPTEKNVHTEVNETTEEASKSPESDRPESINPTEKNIPTEKDKTIPNPSLSEEASKNNSLEELSETKTEEPKAIDANESLGKANDGEAKSSDIHKSLSEESENSSAVENESGGTLIPTKKIAGSKGEEESLKETMDSKDKNKELTVPSKNEEVVEESAKVESPQEILKASGSSNQSKQDSHKKELSSEETKESTQLSNDKQSLQPDETEISSTQETPVKISLKPESERLKDSNEDKPDESSPSEAEISATQETPEETPESERLKDTNEDKPDESSPLEAEISATQETPGETPESEKLKDSSEDKQDKSSPSEAEISATQKPPEETPESERLKDSNEDKPDESSPSEAKISATKETPEETLESERLKDSNENKPDESSPSEAIEKPVEIPQVAMDVLEDKVIEVAAFVESSSADAAVAQETPNVLDVIEIDDDDEDQQDPKNTNETEKKSENETPATETAENKDTTSTATPMEIDEELSTRVPIQPAQEQINEQVEKEKESPVAKINYETTKDPESASSVQVLDDEEDGLLMIDTSHKEENEIENNMDNETATSAPTTDSSSDGSLEVFHDKECVNYECKRGSKNFYRATGFTLSYFKVSRKRSKLQFVCEDCYDRALDSYEELCKTLKQKQPLLHGTTFKCQEFVEIIDSSDEEESEAAGDKAKDENALPTESIEMLEAELEGAIRKVMNNVDIQNQLSWTKQILHQRLTNIQEDSDLITEQLRSLQRKADNMHNSLYQCPKIKLRQLTPLDLNSGRMYNPESENTGSKFAPTIPPAGEIIRQPIRVNEQYYAVKTKAIASWVPCKVIEEVDGYPPGYIPTKTYKIKFTKMAKYPMFKTVYAKHMAYYDPPTVRLPIGSRVIAYFDASILSRGKEKMLIPSAFYPGIIAEPLKQSNKFRYLVFYDDGYFQYVNHKDVRLVCQASENVWEDVHHQSREFIHNYLTQYAVNRPMVQTQKGQSMLVDYNGKWIYARVIDVDCSLVQMLFEGQSRSEWIYRGSTRLGPVYKESNNLAQKNTLNNTRRRTEPFVRYINADDLSSQQAQDQQPPPSTRVLPATGNGEIRSVAKKSVSRVDNSNNNNLTSAAAQQQPIPTVRHLNNSTIFVDDDNKPKGKVVYYTARKNLPPRNYVPHICNPSCPFNITHNLTFYSPLAKPLLSGWERQIFRQKSKKFIVYRGPCGKRLRNIEELHRYLRVTDNELNVDNFDFSPDTNCLAEYVLEKCLVNKKDISCGKEKMPIPCVNYYDESMPPACEYSAVRIPTEGVPLNLDEEFLCGCDCVDDCSDKTKCACWQLTYAGAKYGMPSVPTEMVGYQYKRLYEHVPTGIYECNSRCKCKANCVNRVVQQPLQSKLQVFKTSNRGWGLRCINDVPRGSFICVYAGQMLTEQVANEGGLDAGDEYFAELDYIEVAEQIKEGYESDVQEPEEEEDFYNPEHDDDDDDFRTSSLSLKDREFNTRSRARKGNKNSTDGEFDSQERQVISFEPNKNMDTSTEPNEKPTIRKLFGKDESCYVMDAKVRGNLGRYFNHSCSPNLFVQNVFVDTHDLRFPWVAFFASTHIRAGTELTWNYNYEVGVVPGKVLYCQCGAPNCRQRLL